MENGFYLLNVSISGIKSIKKEVRLDFYKKTVNKNFNPEKYRVKAIYGENGSGKSALITAVKIFRDLIYNENYLNESKTQEFLDEIINKETNVFRFQLEFLVNVDELKLIYQYTLRIGKSKSGLYEIQYEGLKLKSGSYANNNYKTVFESQNGELIYVNSTEREHEWIRHDTLNLLSTHSFIYLYLKNVDQNILIKGENVDKELFISIFACLTLNALSRVYLAEEDQHELYFLRKRFKESNLDQKTMMEGLFGQESNFNAALGVNEKYVDKENFEEYKKRVERLTQFIKIFKPDLVSIDIDAKEDGGRFVCDLNLNYGDYAINKEFESTGIKKLIRLFDCLSFASTGGIVFVDEMDANLNDVYLCKLIEYFMYYGKGQLCFTTHNIGPMSVLKENKNAIDFLSSDNHLVPWAARGNATPENCYRNGMIEDLPFNVEASDFVGIFGE